MALKEVNSGAPLAIRCLVPEGNGVGNSLARIGVVGIDFATFSGTPQFCLHG